VCATSAANYEKTHEKIGVIESRVVIDFPGVISCSFVMHRVMSGAKLASAELEPVVLARTFLASRPRPPSSVSPLNVPHPPRLASIGRTDEDLPMPEDPHGHLCL